MFKKLQDKKSVLENFNPFLTGNTTSSTPSFSGECDNSIDYESINFDVCETPGWLGNDPTMDDNGVWIPSSGYSLGAFYINGKPLTSWGAMFGGKSRDDKKDMMRTYYNVTAYIKSKFPNGFGAFIKSQQNKIETFDITNVKVMEMIPCTNGIGMNMHITFVVNEQEVWGKFVNVGIDKLPKFVCQDIESFSVENKLKVVGKLWNIISDWFKVKPGYYQCVAKKVFVFNEFGQIKELVENNIIEVLHSDDDRIKIKFDDTIMLVKNPVYFWFNWYFIKK